MDSVSQWKRQILRIQQTNRVPVGCASDEVLGKRTLALSPNGQGQQRDTLGRCVCWLEICEASTTPWERNCCPPMPILSLPIMRTPEFYLDTGLPCMNKNWPHA